MSVPINVKSPSSSYSTALNRETSPQAVGRPLGSLIHGFSRPSLLETGLLPAPKITSAKHVTCYNFTHNPTEAAVQEILRREPLFPTSNIDMFACVDTLGDLHSFVRSEDKPFRLLLEAVGNTVFLVSEEFEAKEAHNRANGATMHRILIRFKSGGLNYVVQAECPAHVGESSLANANSTWVIDVQKTQSSLVKTLDGAFNGSKALDEDNFESSRFSLLENLGHEDGDVMNQFTILLHKIWRIAKEHQDELLEIRRSSNDRLEIRKQSVDGSHVLSVAMRDIWAAHHDSDDEVESDYDDARRNVQGGGLVLR